MFDHNSGNYLKKYEKKSFFSLFIVLVGLSVQGQAQKWTCARMCELHNSKQHLY
jgi:hypothetical protein